MTRAFTDAELAPEVVEEFIDAARRAPTAGNTSPASYLWLHGAKDVAQYWDVTLPQSVRASFPWPELLNAPVLIEPFVDPEAYRRRYAEPDKVGTGLGVDEAAWSTPYWWVDGGMAAMTILLAAEEAGLGALFFGVFDHEIGVRKRFGVPEHLRAVGAIALGHPAAAQRRSSSTARGRPPLSDVVHRSHW